MSGATIPLLARRIGTDTVAHLESAAPRRFLEAQLLREKGQLTGAVYLYGYVAESRLAAAYFRLIGYRPSTEITSEARRRVIAAAIHARFMTGTPHDVAGWALLLVTTRKRRRAGYNRQLRDNVVRQARALYARWRPSLRYRTIVPTDAHWFIRESVMEIDD